MKYKIWAIFLLLCIIIFSACGGAIEPQNLSTLAPVIMEATPKTEHLLVGLAHWPPWKIIENGEFDGVDVAILEEIGKRLNITFEYIECPWKRCVEMVKTGDVDMITSFGKSPERDEFVYYIEPFYVKENVVFYSKKRQPDFGASL